MCHHRILFRIFREHCGVKIALLKTVRFIGIVLWELSMYSGIGF